MGAGEGGGGESESRSSGITGEGEGNVDISENAARPGIGFWFRFLRLSVVRSFY